MSLRDVVKEHEECGSREVKLGIVEMPEGYALMLNADETHYYYATEFGESAIHWDRWAVYRWAKHDASFELDSELDEVNQKDERDALQNQLNDALTPEICRKCKVNFVDPRLGYDTCSTCRLAV